jgi:hypothetical protein
MNDNFLYQVRPPVRTEFAVSLRQRLADQFLGPDVQKQNSFQPGQILASQRTWKFALLFFVVFAAAILTFSGQVRASALAWIRTIAGFNVEERAESPLAQIEEGDKQSPDESQSTVVTVIPSPITERPLEEIITDSPFQFSLPGWTPEGFVLSEPAVSTSGNWVMLTWSDADNREIALLVEDTYTGYDLPVGDGSSEEIDLQGKSALLVCGNWDSSHQWNPDLGIALYWLQDGHDYRLIYSEREALHNEIMPMQMDEKVVVEQLVRMAESFQ